MEPSPAPSLTEAARIFFEPRRYADLDGWHAAARRLRREDPIRRVDAPGFEPFVAITRHADIVEIERQPERFWNTDDVVLFPIGQLDQVKAAGAFIRSLVQMDGEQHRATRQITNEWFKPGNLRRTTERRVIELARRFVDRMLEGDGACDFAADIALLYPLHVIMSILGVPESDEPRMLQLTQQLFGNQDPDFGGGDAEAAFRGALVDFGMYFNRMTAERRACAGGDLASTIANGTVHGEPLGDLETIGYYVIVATAGHDTTSSSLAGGLEALIRHPEQLRALQRDPALIDNAVEEIIRWVTPVRHFLRRVQEDYVLRGTTIRAGERVLLSYLSGNRDEEVFADPFRFDVTRANADQHVAFGIGPHFCLGAHLARMELRAFFRELLPRLESIELAGEPEYTATTFVGGPKRVPIRYRLRPGA